MSNLKKIGIAITVLFGFLTVCLVYFVVSVKRNAEHQIPEYNKHLEALEADADEIDTLYYKSTPDTDPSYQRLKADAKIHADAAAALDTPIRTNMFFWSDYQDGRKTYAAPMLSREQMQDITLRFVKPK